MYTEHVLVWVSPRRKDQEASAVPPTFLPYVPVGMAVLPANVKEPSEPELSLQNQHIWIISRKNQFCFFRLSSHSCASANWPPTQGAERMDRSKPTLIPAMIHRFAQTHCECQFALFAFQSARGWILRQNPKHSLSQFLVTMRAIVW